MPARRNYAWLAVATMALAIYVSLIPFRLRAMPVGEAVHQFGVAMTSPLPEHISRTNYIGNVLLFIPIGFGLAGARLADRPRRSHAALTAATTVLPISIAVSVTAEFLQVFAPGRVPARADVEAQTIGCIAGMAAWLLAGQPLTGWLRHAQAPSGLARVRKALVAYAVAWIIFNLAPFDFTFDAVELSAQRSRTGQIRFVPFAGTERPVSRVVWDALITTISAMPLGMLAPTLSAEGKRWSALAAFAGGTALVLAMEVAQLFITSHAADATDGVVFGCVGVALGVALGRRLLPDGAAGGPIVERLVPRGWRPTLLAAWCLILLIYHWMPYDFRAVPRWMIRRRLARMSLVPLAGHASGSDLNALNDLLLKIGLSVPLGVIGAFFLRPNQWNAATIAASLLAASVLFAGIEAGQLFLPSRWFDPSDVLIGVSGTAAGLWLGRWLRGNP